MKVFEGGSTASYTEEGSITTCCLIIYTALDCQPYCWTRLRGSAGRSRGISSTSRSPKLRLFRLLRLLRIAATSVS